MAWMPPPDGIHAINKASLRGGLQPTGPGGGQFAGLLMRVAAAVRSSQSMSRLRAELS